MHKQSLTIFPLIIEEIKGAEIEGFLSSAIQSIVPLVAFGLGQKVKEARLYVHDLQRSVNSNNSSSEAFIPQ